MEPNQNTNIQNATSVPTSTGVSNVSSTSLNMPDKSVESSKPGSDVAFQGKSKKSHGMLYGMILLAILAAGGIGFGVWAMMDGNSQVAKKDEQIADLRGQLAEKSGMVEDDMTVVDTGDGISSSANVLKNPVIVAESPMRYSVFHTLSVVLAGSGNTVGLDFMVDDGNKLTCRFQGEASNCEITGVPDGIYKMATLHEGNGLGSEKIGFLMQDGTVWFAPIYNNNDANSGAIRTMVAKKANIDGFVKDIVEIQYTADVNVPTSGSGFSTVFVMSDNSIIRYDESMFK